MDKELKRFFELLIIEDYKMELSYSYLTEISILTIKSLLPSIRDIAVKIDYRRFIEELKLWLYYRSGYNSSLHKLNQIDYNNYYKEKDNSILYRIIPILIVNKDKEIMQEEVIKNILFTTGNLESLFENLLIAHTITAYLNKENILEELKKVIINFSQEEYTEKYSKCYRHSYKNEKKFKIDFELNKITLIDLFNDVKIQGFKNLIDLLKVIEDIEYIPTTFIGNIMKSYLNEEYLEIDKFYESLGDYLIKLRNSRVNPEQLFIKEYVLPDLFNCNEGEQIFHSLLGDTVVISKSKNTITLKTKSGNYLLKNRHP